jgi:endonuclease G
MSTIDASTLREAQRARGKASAHYLRNPRVTLIDVGWRIRDGAMTDELAVRVHVRSKPRGPEAEAFMAQRPELAIRKERIPFLVDIIEATYPLHWHIGLPQPPLRGRVFDRLHGGISISSDRQLTYGTLGGIVLDGATDAPMILSNWHVLAGSAYARSGLRIFQPGTGDGGGPRHVVARLDRHAMDMGIDAAVARLTGSRDWVNDQIELGPVRGVTQPSLGALLEKSGRGSGRTSGMIDGIEGEYAIRYGGLPRRIRHVCRVVPASGTEGEVSRGGDSGSWWLELENRRAVALHFAGSDDPETALAISMPEVLAALQVRLALGEAVEPLPERAYA